MAKNIQSLQLLRNSQIFPDKAAAINGITGSTTQDGVIKLARYTEGDETKTIFGIYHDFGSGNASYTIYDSYQEVIADIQERIADLESGSTEAIEEINKKLGSGVTTANTVTSQLEALSGDSSTAQSGDTSVEGAKKYADEKIAQAVDALDYTDTAVTGSYVSAVDETDGVISVTRVALPSVADTAVAKKFVTEVDQTNGEISVSRGEITSTDKTITLTDGNDGGIDFAVNIDGETIVKDANTGVLSVANSALVEYVGDDATINVSAPVNNKKTISTLLTLSSITPSSTTVKEEYALVDASGVTKGQTVKIYKDSSLVSITYITDTGDTHYQNLEYVYVDNSGNTNTEYVDMSSLVLETEFASGVTFSNGVAHGVVDPTSETFLTVGENGFKLSGVQDAIDAAYEGLDATVTGETSDGHITISIEELDGKLVQSGLTITEDNIANADDLADLSAKTVTEIASSNSSITVATAATPAADGTVKYDVITDASKIQMSGFTGADVLSGITQASSITEAFLEVDKVITENEETVSAALNDLEETKVENIVVNGVTGTFNNKVASVTIDGNDVVLGADYVKPAQGSAIATGDTVDAALGKLEARVDAAVAGGVTSIVAGNGIEVDATQQTTPTVSVDLKADAGSGDNDWHNPLKFDSDGGLYFDSLDCGTY